MQATDTACETAGVAISGSVFGELASTTVGTTDFSPKLKAAVECCGLIEEVELWEGKCKQTGGTLDPATGIISRGAARGTAGSGAGSQTISDGAGNNQYVLSCDSNGVPSVVPKSGGTATDLLMVGDQITFAKDGTFADNDIVVRVKSINTAKTLGIRVLEGGTEGASTDRTAANTLTVAAAGNLGDGAVDAVSTENVDDASTSKTYTVAACYDTIQPRWFVDGTHSNVAGGVEAENVKKYAALSVYGGRTNLMSSHNIIEASAAWRSDKQQLFQGIDTAPLFQRGYNFDVTATAEATPANRHHHTTAVVADDAGTGLSAKSESADVYAYVGRGYDTLWVTPTPDEMTGQRVVLKYTGPSGGCSVSEVTRGSHEGAVCSGRGVCDSTTGTCQCDAGYTLEACSEQTVLV